MSVPWAPRCAEALRSGEDTLGWPSVWSPVTTTEPDSTDRPRPGQGLQPPQHLPGAAAAGAELCRVCDVCWKGLAWGSRGGCAFSQCSLADLLSFWFIQPWQRDESPLAEEADGAAVECPQDR